MDSDAYNQIPENIYETPEEQLNVQNDVELEIITQTSDDDEVMLNFSNRGSRNKKRNTKSWIKSKRKSNNNNGLEYSSANGKILPSRNSPKILSNCCRFTCFEKFSKTDLDEINSTYWNLGEYSRQRDYIKYNVRSKSCARVKKGGEAKRQFTNEYFLNEKKVCKKMFLSSLNISAKVIQVVKTKELMCLDVGRNYRGGDTNSINHEDKELVRQHIKSFPVIESHYCRASTKRLYFYSDLNQNKLYELYLEMMKSEYPVKTPVKPSMYKYIFCNDFNISFHTPKKDSCKYCEAKTNGVSTEAENDKHIKRKQLARIEKDLDKSKALESANNSFRAFTFDLQAVLYSPCSTVSSLYYSRKFSSYNFTIFDQSSKEGFCYIWNENNGLRGSDEIGSILFKFLKTLPAETKHVSFFSDSCGGQNRNRFIASVLKVAVAILPLDCIDLKFLEVGHTQMEVDAMHSVIERHTKSLTVYSPLEWPNIVRGSKRNKPYIVNDIIYQDVFDLKKLKKDFITGTFLVSLYNLYNLIII